MAKKGFSIELNSAGVQELLKSNEIRSVCEQEAGKIMARLGDGYQTSTYTGKTRVNVSIAAVTWDAYRDNLANNTVLKALK